MSNYKGVIQNKKDNNYMKITFDEIIKPVVISVMVSIITTCLIIFINVYSSVKVLEINSNRLNEDIKYDNGRIEKLQSELNQLVLNERGDSISIEHIMQNKDNIEKNMKIHI
jgi:predicted PurR-regulated permease PerM